MVHPFFLYQLCLLGIIIYGFIGQLKQVNIYFLLKSFLMKEG
jgi:hypothetical protein